MNIFLNFLNHLYEDGKAYSTINTYRSAVSSTIEAVTGKQVGCHHLVSRFMKGVFVGRPPQSKYSTAWDVSQVTEYLQTLCPLSGLSLKELTLKVVTLLALVSAQRCQSLHFLNLNNMSVMEKQIVFVIKDRVKTSRPGKDHQRIVISSFSDDIRLCPFTHLKEYLKRTESLRSNNDYLFISYCKPYKEVCSSSIARWLKTVLSLSNIDTTIFKAHSYRSAVASKALLKGASVSDIMKLADWSRVSTFNKYYRKPIIGCNTTSNVVLL